MQDCRRGVLSNAIAPYWRTSEQQEDIMILVTGGTGTIGKATVAALQAAGQRFKVAARSPQQVKIPGVETVTLDWSELDTYLPAMRGVDRLFLLTPNSERQVGYVVQAVAAARRAGVKHIARLSVMGADADPGIILGRLHFAAEREVKLSGIPWTMLRPTFFMQNFVNYYGVQPNKDCEVRLPHGQGKAGWVDARDVGEAAAKVLSGEGYEGKTFDMTGPEALTTGEVLAVLSEAFGHKYTYVDAPEDEVRKAMEGMKMPLWLVDGFMELHGLIKNGHAATLANGVQTILGREPRSLRDWAQSLVSRKAER
jgi:uncharacterized protein YbjT (DUF2867 family)